MLISGPLFAAVLWRARRLRPRGRSRNIAVAVAATYGLWGPPFAVASYTLAGLVSPVSLAPNTLGPNTAAYELASRIVRGLVMVILPSVVGAGCAWVVTGSKSVLLTMALTAAVSAV